MQVGQSCSWGSICQVHTSQAGRGVEALIESFSALRHFRPQPPPHSDWPETPHLPDLLSEATSSVAALNASVTASLVSHSEVSLESTSRAARFSRGPLWSTNPASIALDNGLLSLAQPGMPVDRFTEVWRCTSCRTHHAPSSVYRACTQCENDPQLSKNCTIVPQITHVH